MGEVGQRVDATNPDSAAGGDGLGTRATRGVLWGVAQKWVQRLGGLLTIVILARLLSPEEFGLVAAASAIIPVLYLLADMGFSTYITQADEVSDKTLATAFWYAMCAGCVFTGLLALCAPLLGVLFGLPEITPVLLAMSPTVLLVALSSVPIALLRRRLDFRSIAIQSSVATLAGQVAAIALALTGFGVWALVAQSLLSQLFVTVLAWWYARFRPGLHFSVSRFREMIRFGTTVIAVEFVALCRFWAETAIVGAVLGVAGLGYLNIAQRLIQTTQDLSAAAVVPVSTVVFAQLKLATERASASYVRALGIIYVLVMPVMVIVLVGAPWAVPLLFGDQWSASVRPAQALAIAAIFTLGAVLDNGLFYGLGRPGTWLIYALVVDGLTVAATAIAVHFGLDAVALSFIAVAAGATMIRWVLVSRLLSTRILLIVTPFFICLVPAIISAGAGFAVSAAVGEWPPILALAAIGGVVMLVQLAAVRLLLPKLFASTLTLVRRSRRGDAQPIEIPQPNENAPRWDNLTPAEPQRADTHDT
jgi:O-antigen/teichoic acid export membrane protein